MATVGLQCKSKLSITMKGLEQYIWPYIISQGASIIILIIAWKKTRWARILFALLFFWASGTNMYIGIIKPGTYQLYADMAIPAYRNFINGWFSHYNYIMIPVIAAGQFLIAISILLKGWWVKGACIGAIIFLLSIAPLLVGSAFPFSITVSLAACFILRNDDKNYLWKKLKH
jgi:hypothetical protein